jgi:hypothetical protein
MAATTCSNGHPADPSFAFCPRCGSPVEGTSEDARAIPPMGDRDVADSAPSTQPQSVDEDNPSQLIMPPPQLPRLDSQRRGLGRGTLLASLGGLAAVVIAIGAWSLGGADAHTITGELELREGFSDMSEPCEGWSGYDDIHAGAPVLIKDAAGTVVGTGALEPGKLRIVDQQDFDTSCVFSFEVSDVADSDFYSVDVAGRGDLNYSRSELDMANWNVYASLG